MCDDDGKIVIAVGSSPLMIISMILVLIGKRSFNVG